MTEPNSEPKFYTLTLWIEDGSAADLNIRFVAARDHLSLEDAAIKILAAGSSSAAPGNE